jgi:hypothetical protein
MVVLHVIEIKMELTLLLTVLKKRFNIAPITQMKVTVYSAHSQEFLIHQEEFSLVN